MSNKAKTDRVKIEDVAREANVSIMSVSRAMRGVEGISPAKREQILNVARRMGYAPNKVAMSLAASSSSLIGVSVPTLFGSVFSEIFNAMRPTLDRAGFQTIFDTTDYLNENEETWVRRMLTWHPAGLILTGFHQSENTVEMLKESAIPVMQIWDYTENPIDLCIGIDHFEAAAEIGKHLIDLGYKRPSYIGIYEGKDPRAEKRYLGLRETFNHSGVDFILVERNSNDASFKTGYEATTRLLSEQTDWPDVICFLNDHMAFGGMMACESYGLKIPDDIGIVGYNDLNINTALNKKITTSITPRAKIGEMGAQMLVAKILGAAPPKPDILLPTRLLPGHTTRRQH